MVTLLQTLAPKAKITLETGGKRLSVVASPADHVTVKAAVEQMDKMLQLEEKGKLVTYPVTPAQRKRFESMVSSLSSELPGIQVLKDTEPSELSIWAKPSQHVAIAEILDQLKRDGAAGEKLQLAVYPIRASDPDSVMTVLKNLFPNAQCTLDKRGRKIMVWTTPSEQEQIKASIETLDAGGAGGAGAVQEKLTVYPVTDADPSTVVSYLEEQVPDAKLTANAKAGTILAWARPADHQTIAKILKDLESGSGQKPQVVVYRVGEGDSKAISLILGSLLPKATVVVDPKSGSIAATATAREHEMIRSVVEQMSKKEPPETAPRIVVYRVKSAPPAPGRRGAFARAEVGAIPMLRTMFPEAQIAPGAESDEIAVLARPAEHEKIKVAIDQLNVDDPAVARRMAVYAMESPGKTGAAGIIATLTQMFPDAQFSAGNEPDKMVVWARSDDHKPIETAIQQLSKKEPPEKAPKVIVYQIEAVGPITPTNAISLLTAMYPEAQFSSGQEPGTIVVLARQADHDKIKATIAEMSQKGPPDKVRKMVIYTVAAGASSASPYYAAQALSGVITTLTEMFPNAKFAVGPGSEKVIAWALPEDHKRIAETIAEITKPEPPDKAFKMVVYTVPASTVTSRLSGAAGTTTGSAGVITALTAMFPSAKFSQGPDPEQVIAWARPDDHKLIAEMVNELVKPEPDEKARTMVVYTVPTTPDAAARFSPRAWAPGTGGAITALTAMFPHAKFYPGPTSDKVFAWARPDEHKEIAEVVLEMSRPEPAATARKIAVYTVPTTPGDPAGITGAVALLSAMFPDAKFSAGAEPGTVIAWARSEDHKVIAQAVEEVSKKPPPGKARTMVAYTLESSGRYSDPSGRVALIQSLRQAFSDALFFPGATRGRVVVWARPDDHATIKKAFEEMSKREPLESAPRVESYEVAVLGGTAAMTMLSTAYPEAQFSVGDDPNALIVRARPADHELIKATIEQIEATGKAGAKRTLVVYPFKAEDLLTFTDKLDPVLKRRVQLMPDEPRNRLLVWADPKYHQALKQAIDEFTREASKGGDPVSQVYRLDWADPKIVSQVVANVVPNAKVTLDATNRSLVVHAMPEEHARIKATVQQIDNLEGSGMAPSLEIHRMKTGSPDDVLPVLEGLFQMHPSVQLSADRRNESIVAFCTPAQHKTIRTLVEQLEKGMAADSEVRLQTYPLGDMYGYDVVDTLTTLLEKQGITAELSIESRTDSLLVIARPEAHKLILETLEKLKAEERTLQIVQLEVLDPSTAQLAIGRLFGDGLSYRSTNPDVEIDEATEQLFIRATAAQHVKIRELLAKMGETGVAGDADGRTRRSRVIPIRGDVPKTVEQLQKIWPQLRSNPLQVIPAQGQPKRSSGSKSERFGKSGIQKADGPMDVPPGRLPKNEVKTAKSQEEAAADAEGWRPATRQGEAAPAPDTGAAEKPVLIIPGSRSITVTSDDPEALDQIDKLLRALTQQRGPIGRNYNVYMLQNANAIGVAAILQNFFRSQYGGRFMRANQVTIVPDERLNAIIAYAGRADRITIENLLDVLDSAEIAQPLAFDRLQFIPVENIPADRMAQVLQELYGTQVGAISVEENTNSLIVMAAPTMVEHLQQVVEKLDEAAGAESDRTVEIISLRNSSSERVEAALNMLLGPRLQAAARTAPRTPRSAAPGAPAVAGATGQPAGPMTPTSPRARTRRGAGAAGVAGTSPAYRRSAQPTPRPSYRPAMPSGTAPAPMQPTVPRARATPRAGSPATGQGTSPTAPRAAPSTMFRPAQSRPTSPAPPRIPAAPRPRGRTAAPTGQPGGGTP
jgi:type II secretory pathway component GspD/PulD (secretin)